MNRPSAAFLTSLGVWPVRAVWLVLPLVVGPALGRSLDGSSRPVQVVASAGLWGVWAVTLLATLVPRTVSLTLVRVVAPAVPAVALAAVLSGRTSTAAALAALVGAVVTVGVVFAPTTGETFVNGSAYGHEARFPLRVPGPVLLGPLELVWSAMLAAAVAGPLLLAAKQWIPGVAAAVVGALVLWWGARVLHTLARRWVVLVPAGMVLHDPLVLSEPVLLRRNQVKVFEPALSDTDAVDLTRGALGLALEVRTVEPVHLIIGPGGRGATVQPVEVDRLLFTPTRPGALLAAARARHMG